MKTCINGHNDVMKSCIFRMHLEFRSHFASGILTLINVKLE